VKEARETTEEESESESERERERERERGRDGGGEARERSRAGQVRRGNARLASPRANERALLTSKKHEWTPERRRALSCLLVSLLLSSSPPFIAASRFSLAWLLSSSPSLSSSLSSSLSLSLHRLYHPSLALSRSLSGTSHLSRAQFAVAGHHRAQSAPRAGSTCSSAGVIFPTG